MTPEKMIQLTIAVLIFGGLIGTIAASVASALNNLTGGAATLYALSTLIIVAVFIVFLSKQMGGKK